MALNATYGLRPGESLAVQAGQNALGATQQQSYMQFQADQAAKERELRDVMQKRALKQNAVLGGIQAATGIASTLIGGIGAIPGIVEGFRNLAGPTARQIQQQQFGQELGLRQRGIDASLITQGAQAGLDIMKLAEMKADRQAKLEQAQTSYGTDEMLAEIPQAHQQQIVADAQAGDQVALTRAKSTGLMTFTPAQNQQLQTLQRRRDEIAANVDGRYSADRQQFLLSQIDTQMAVIDQSPVVNRSRPMTARERMQSQISTIPIQTSDGGVFNMPLTMNSRGNPVVLETPEYVASTKRATRMGELQAEADFIRANPDSPIAHELRSKSRGSSGSGSDSMFTEDGNINLGAFTPETLMKLRKDMVEEKRENWKALNPRGYEPQQDKAGNVLNPPPEFVVSDDELRQRIVSMGRGPLSATSEIGMDRSNAIQTADRFGNVRFMDSVVPQHPQNNPLRYNGPLRPDPMTQDGQNPLRRDQQGAAQQQQQAQVVQSEYDKVAYYVPRRPGVKSRMSMTATTDSPNLPAMLGLDSILVENDGQSVLPIIPDRQTLERYAKIVPPGTGFITSDGRVARTLKPTK